MTAKQFYDTVVLMREAQKNYFKTKHSSYLCDAKRYEKEIDKEIIRVDKLIIEQNNPKLF